MINEKELRTGNLYSTIRSHIILVKGFDTVNKYVLIDPKDMDLEITTKRQDTIIFEDLNPIELTEQRVLQMGFTKEESISVKVVSDKGAQFEWDEKNSEIVLRDCESGIIGQSMKYVHQFQNLFYYLTGKEAPLL
jgi:Fe2+ transport system protein FeoA